MDPNENIREQRVISSRIIDLTLALSDDDKEYTDDCKRELIRLAERLADLSIALDGWMQRGGFPPVAWMEGR